MNRKYSRHFEVQGEDQTADYYADPGLKKNALPQDIRSTYRKLARKLHPDRNPERKFWAREQMKSRNEACGVLFDRVKRSTYDAIFSRQWLGEVKRTPRQASVNYYYLPQAYTYKQGDAYPRDAGVNLRKDRKGFYVVNATGEQTSDYCFQIERSHGFIIGVYYDLKKYWIHPLTGKPLTQVFKQLKFQNGILVAVTGDDLKVAIEPSSGWKSKEYKDIKVANGRILDKTGLLKWQEISRTFYVGD